MTTVTFALASCQYPAGVIDSEPAQASFMRLDSWAIGLPRPRLDLLVRVGDQVYVDATAGLFDAVSTLARYEAAYRDYLPIDQVVERKKSSNVMRRYGSLKFAQMLDDHEIADNWEPIEGETSARDAVLRNALDYYWKYQRGGPAEAKLDTTLLVAGCHFFLANTRTERTPRNAKSVRTARIMSREQFDRLCAWLEQDPGIPHVVACPALLLPRRRVVEGSIAHALQSDGWDGYPASLYELLAFIARAKIQNVVFVSGNEHLGFLARIYLSEDGQEEERVIVHSIHTPALYAPYPFANAFPEEFIARDLFEFDDPSRPSERKRFRCRVKTVFPIAAKRFRSKAGTGDGFVVGTLDDSSGAWRMRVEFDLDVGRIAYDCRLAPDRRRAQSCATSISAPDYGAHP